MWSSEIYSPSYDDTGDDDGDDDGNHVILKNVAHTNVFVFHLLVYFQWVP